MTHQQNGTAMDRVLGLLTEQGFEGMADAIAILMNEAMKIERSQFLGAESHERTAHRRGYANGFKPKRVKSRIGSIDLQVPQVRDVEDG